MPLCTTQRIADTKHTVVEVKLDGKSKVIQKDTTKTKSSLRTLPLVAPFEKLLRELKKQQEINRQVCGSCYCNDYLEYVNVNAIGELMKPNFITQHFEILLAKNKLKKIRFHDLRHPYVKHTTKNFSCKSRNPKPSNVMVWDFCFDYKFLDALVHLNSSS